MALKRPTIKNLQTTNKPLVHSEIVNPLRKKEAKLEAVPLPHPKNTSEPLAIGIGMPSRFYFYEFKDLFITPFKTKHLAKLNHVNETGDLRSLCETISSILSTSSGEQNLGFKLNLGDFAYVLHRQYQDHFKGTPLTVTAYCENEDHIAEVEALRKPKDSLVNKVTYASSAIKIVELLEAPPPLLIKGNRVRPPTLSDMLWMSDDPTLLTNNEFLYLVGIASYLEVLSPGSKEEIPIMDKVKYVEETLEDVDVYAIDAYRENAPKFGVEESVKTNCVGCGASMEINFSIDASTFL